MPNDWSDDLPKKRSATPWILGIVAAFVIGGAGGIALGVSSAPPPAPVAQSGGDCAVMQGLVEACDAGVAQLVQRLRTLSGGLAALQVEATTEGATETARELGFLTQEIEEQLARFDRIAGQ